MTRAACRPALLALALAGAALAACVPPPPPPCCGTVVPYSVYFPLGSTALNNEGRTAIENAAAAAGRRPASAQVDIIGHADAIGGTQANNAISEARAKVVAAALEREGVARERIVLRAAGDSLPVAPTGPDGREPVNRRVDIIVR